MSKTAGELLAEALKAQEENNAKIDALLAQGAPMRVYIRDDEQPTASSSN